MQAQAIGQRHLLEEPQVANQLRSHSSQTDESGSGVEGWNQKWYPKNTNEDSSVTNRRLSTHIGRGIPEPKRTASNRRTSIRDRDQTAPLGPRPRPGPRDRKSLLNKSSTETPGSLDANRTELSTNLDARVQTSADNALSSSSTVGQSSGTVDFLPWVNFDDFHSSITSNDLTLNQFPAPGGGASILGSEDASSREGDNKSRRDVTSAESKPDVQKTSSYMRFTDDGANGTSRGRTGNLPSGSSDASIAYRTRRQTADRISSSGSVPRAPRKSVGPGILDTHAVDGSSFRPRAKLNSSISNADVASRRMTASTSVMSINGIGQQVKQSAPPRSSTLRDLKAKSLQPPPRLSQDFLDTPHSTSEHARSFSTNTARSPGRSPARRPTSPHSSNKRLSMAPPPAHATGLGARTISPTDARRLKRLSMHNPSIILVTSTPPTPQPGRRSAAASPSFIPRKSLTPTSSRTTPDPNRKSYSSGISTSSNTSYNSVRNSPGLQQRNTIVQSSSRLPTPKPRSSHGASTDNDDVPPVPAIPKAYESPKELTDQPFFTNRKGSLPFDATSVNSSSTTDNNTGSSNSKDGNHASRHNNDTELKNNSSKRSPIDSDGQTVMTASLKKKQLQPLRLPPLNLLPLSTPTVAKVAAIRATSGTKIEEGSVTPPPRRPSKTPATPMTASKAAFFSNGEEETVPIPIHLRSSSSHHFVSADSPGFGSGSTSSSAAQAAVDGPTDRQAISPYVSTSLPKSSGEFSSMLRKFSGEHDRGIQGPVPRNTKLTGPRALKPKHAALETDAGRACSPTTDPDTPSSSSIRRKLSLSWRKSSSKGSNGLLDNSTKTNDMPPPRLPASATWTGNLHRSPSPSAKPTPRFLTSRRKSSASNLAANNHNRVTSDSWDNTQSGHSNRKDSQTADLPETPAIPRSITTIQAARQKTVSAKSSTSTLKSRRLDPELDLDDLSAEEEMKKLSMKRKDFENAARLIDDLRKRATPKESLSPTQALRVVDLNIFERGEIIDYKEVYFCGTPNAKKHVGDLTESSANFGYDDERGDYNIVDGDHLAYRYEIVDVLGKGSFGQVVRCVDHKTGGLTAVKIIRNKKRFHQQALVEVNILKKVKEWDPHDKHSMINFTHSFYFRGHLCISSELLGMNLYEFIKTNDFRGFTLKLIRRFTKQLLSCLVVLQKQRVIHCDLKPENILLAHPVHSKIKVIDFGSSCFENEKVYTYIQSRFYRSPEVILGMSYGMPIDMWSLGCILAELFTGYPIFPGENEQEQLACIMEVFGPPEKHLIEKSTRKKLFFDSFGKPRLTVSTKGRRRRPSSKTLQSVLKCDDESFLDFLSRCLRWDPDRRLRPDDALRHEFITGIKRQTRLRADSPVKRQGTISTRPLPDPPSTSLKVSNTAKTKDVRSSPVKPTAPKRHSTVHGLSSNLASKRTSTGAALATSSLPRVATRSASGKPDLAASAAAKRQA